MSEVNLRGASLGRADFDALPREQQHRVTMQAYSWISLSLLIAQTGVRTKAQTHRFLESQKQGVWAIARDADATQAGQCSEVLLASLLEQVTTGEDLTAAFLVAHGRVSRQLPESQGAEVVAARLNRGGSSFELAWVGGLQGFLVRGREVLPLTTKKNAAGGGSKALLVATTRVDALGAEARVRPKIDRKLSHGQRGDILVLTSDTLDAEHIASDLAEGLKGFWSFEYKARKLQRLLQARLNVEHKAMPLLLCLVK